MIEKTFTLNIEVWPICFFYSFGSIYQHSGSYSGLLNDPVLHKKKKTPLRGNLKVKLKLKFILILCCIAYMDFLDIRIT